jgi:TolA-binding protein
MPPVSRPVSNPTTDPALETEVFWLKYRTPVIVALIAVLLGSAAYGGYNFVIARRDSAAAELLAEAKSGPDYQKVINDYPSASAAASAYLFLAESQRNEKKLADANATLKTFVEKNPKHELVPTAKMAMAGSLESLGKADEALEMYKRVAAEHPKSYNAPFALLAQAHLLKLKGQIDEARRACETVITQYRDSYASTEASRYLRVLKPGTTAAVSAPATSAAPVTSPGPAATP